VLLRNLFYIDADEDIGAPNCKLEVFALH